MKRTMMRIFFTAILLSLSLVVAHAQSASTATITGTAVDPRGAVVGGATVVVKNVETGIERTTQTNSEGVFRFDNLRPGLYDLKADAQGFSTAEAKAVKLQVGETRDVKFNLAIAGATGTVNVTADVPLVEATKTDVSTVVTDRQVATLPTTTSFNGIGGVANDYAGLAASAPGVKYDTANISSDLIGPGSVNNRGIMVNIDGGNISDQVVSNRDALGASVEEVKEFQVLTNNYNAEYGQAGGIILNVITKSGTNGFHGDAHYYTRGRNLAASNYFYNQGSEAEFRKAPFHKYEGGLTAGGPIVKNRTFWFVAYEQVRQGVPLVLTPPSGVITTTQPTKELLYSGKIEHQFSTKNQLFARYAVQRDISDNLLVQIAPIATPESLVASVIHDNTFNISDTWTISSSTINEFRFLWHRFLTQTPTKSLDPGLEGPNFYHGAAFCCPQGGLQKRYQFIDNLTSTHGTHTIKVGANISHFPYFSLFTQINRGLYDYDLPEPNRGPATFFTIGLGPAQVNASDNIYGFYGQDAWRVRPNLTLNYGLRYDVEVGAFTGGSIKGGPSGCTQGNGIVPACSKDHNNFQPRVGVAWSPRFTSGFFHMLFGDPDKSVVRASFAEITQLAYLNVSLDSLNFDGVNLLTVGSGAAAILAFAPNRPPDAALDTLRPAGFFGRLRPISTTLGNPEQRNVNVTISRQFGRNFVLDVGYLGVFGRGLFGERDTNYPVITPDPAHAGYFYLANRPDSRFTAVRTNENSRRSGYNGLLVSAQKRMSNHLAFQAGYVYSKLLTNSEDFYGLSEPADPRNVNLDYSRAYNDLRHQANFSLVYETGQMASGGFARHFVNNWTVGVVGRLEAGRPYPISTGDGPFSGSTFFGAGNETVQRPNVLAGGVLSTSGIAGRGSNLLIGQGGVTACVAAGFSAAQCGAIQNTFLAPAGASGSGPIDSLTGETVDFKFLSGDLERNAGQGSTFYRFDFSFIKAFPIPKHEQMRFELKLDVFNIFNRANFLLFNGNPNLNELTLSLNPVTGLPAANFFNCTVCQRPNGTYVGSNGQVLTVNDLRHGFTDALKAGQFGALGNASATDLPRVFQISGRFRW
jgi:hypothetical protein